MRNFSQAADNNRAPILEKLKLHFNEQGTVLELASGSGQHAIYFSEHLPELTWQPTDRQEMLEVLHDNVSQLAPDNVRVPMGLEVGGDWPDCRFKYAYSANLLHIMSGALIPAYFAGMQAIIEPGGVLCVYGPFRYRNAFTTESNARFDGWLKQNHPDGGIRDIEVVLDVAAEHGFVCLHDYDMPANNQLLVFKKESG